MLVIDQIKPQNSAVLAEYFRGKEDEKIVNTLINWENILDEGVEAEFSGALDRLIEHANEQLLNQLLEEEKKQGLDKEKKRLLKKLLIQ